MVLNYLISKCLEKYIIWRGLDIAPATRLIILLLIWSGPEALLGSKFTITSRISSSVISILSKTLLVSSSKGGKTACESSKVEIEAKYELRQSDFSSSVTCKRFVPDAVVVLRGGMDDTESFFAHKMLNDLPKIFFVSIKIRKQRKF